MRCEEVVEILPGVVAGATVADKGLRRHVESCLHCQAELVQYRRLLKALHQLRTEVLEPAPGLLSDLLASIEAAGERGAIRSLLAGRRAAYVARIAAATAAAGAAGTPTRRQPQPRPAPQRTRTSPAEYTRQVRAELRKVAWPTRAEVMNYSVIVLVALVILMALIFALDWAFGKGVFYLFKR